MLTTFITTFGILSMVKGDDGMDIYAESICRPKTDEGSCRGTAVECVWINDGSTQFERDLAAQEGSNCFPVAYVDCKVDAGDITACCSPQCKNHQEMDRSQEAFCGESTDEAIGQCETATITKSNSSCEADGKSVPTKPISPPDHHPKYPCGVDCRLCDESRDQCEFYFGCEYDIADQICLAIQPPLGGAAPQPTFSPTGNTASPTQVTSPPSASPTDSSDAPESDSGESGSVDSGDGGRSNEPEGQDMRIWQLEEEINIEREQRREADHYSGHHNNDVNMKETLRFSDQVVANLWLVVVVCILNVWAWFMCNRYYKKKDAQNAEGDEVDLDEEEQDELPQQI